MSVLVLELNDAGILARTDASAGAAGPPPSPGYALVDSDSILAGTPAAESARLKPKRIHSRFWNELDTSPLPHPFPSGLSAADLAHAHLASIWESARGGVTASLLAVPGTASEPQLGLTLGIARACGMPVHGLVDSALAAAATVEALAGSVRHLDLQLHRVVATELAAQGGLVRGSVKVSGNTGLAALHDAWARRIAETFVGHTRFDPLHAAATEQELYLALPAVLERLCAEQRAALELRAPRRAHTVELTRGDLAAAARDHYDVILHMARQEPRGTLLLSSRITALPGLVERLADASGAEPILLPPGAAATGALRYREVILAPGEALPFVTRLPGAARQERSAPASIPLAPAGLSPTHVIHGGVAHAIGSGPFVLGSAVPEKKPGLSLDGAEDVHCILRRSATATTVEDRSSGGTFVNDRRIDGTADLAAGDRLRLGKPGVELQLIALEEPHGPPQR
jgi:hypothetical protein